MIEQFDSALLHGTLTDTTNLDQSGPGSNDNEEDLYILPSSMIGVSPSDAV